MPPYATGPTETSGPIFGASWIPRHVQGISWSEGRERSRFLFSRPRSICLPEASSNFSWNTGNSDFVLLAAVQSRIFSESMNSLNDVPCEKLPSTSKNRKIFEYEILFHASYESNRS